MAGVNLKNMADEQRSLVVEVPRVYQTDKENLASTQEAGMKTFSPFVKHAPKSFKILSDDEKIFEGKGSKVGNVIKNKTSHKRKSLATLQQSSEGKGKLAGNGRDTFSIKEAFKRKQESKHNATKVDVKISEASRIMSTNILVSETKEAPCIESGDEQLVNEALVLMKQTENVDDSYWKQIAEERRDALEETITENEKLYDRIDDLTQENEKLKTKLNDAKCYKLLYENLLAGKDH